MRFLGYNLMLYGVLKGKEAVASGNSKVYTLMNNRNNMRSYCDVMRLFDLMLDRKNRNNKVVV
jgi:hypothetical protein